MLKRGLLIILCLMLAAGTALADGGQILDGRWLCTNIDGNVTAETPAELKDNYDLYVNKDWYIETSIAEGKSNVATVSQVSDIVNDQLIALLKDETLTGHDAELVQKAYRMLTDWDYRNALGVEPLRPTVEALTAADSTEALYAFLCESGLFEAWLPITVDVSADLEDSSVYITWVHTPSLLLKDAAEYTTRTQAGDLNYTKNQQLSLYMLQRMGFSEEEAAAAYENAIACETLYAAHIKPQADHYLPDYRKSQMNYYSEQELAELAGDFPIIDMIKTSGLYGGKRFLVPEPAFFSALPEIFTAENVPLIRDWLLVRIVLDATDLLDREMYEQTKAIENAASGISGMLSDDLYALNIIKSYLSVPLDSLYIKTYCTEQMKQEVTGIIQEVLDYYHGMLGKTEWLSEETRGKAIEKLDTMRVNAVYPDHPADWSELDFAGKEENGDLLAFDMAVNGYIEQIYAARIDQPVDKREWDQISRPSFTVNASYSPSRNAIIIYSGFLNGGLYNSEMSREQKLAGIGTVVGHEISHAFDTNGAQYDKTGSLVNWWTDEDYAAFQARAQKLAAWYDGFIPYEGCQYSGSQVQTEAIADMAGLKCIIDIAAQEENFDYDAFFRQYAVVWRNKMYLNRAVQQLATDVHPMAYMRINANLAQFDEFLNFYGIQPGDGMYIAPEDRVAVW